MPTGLWSPRCPKCGKITDRTVTPLPNQVLAGRLSPRALADVMGERERCPKCSTWFPLSVGTEWVERDAPVKPRKSEGRGGPEMEGAEQN